VKPIGYEEGRSLQLISADEIKPLRGGPFILDVAAAIAARYRFISVPQNLAPDQSRKFENGVIMISTLTIPINSFEIYGDGLLVSTCNTDESDLVLDDFLEWVITQFGLRRPTTLVPRKYVSRIIIDFDHMLDAFAKPLAVLSETPAQAFGMDTGRLCLTQVQVGPFPPTQYVYQSTWTLAKRINDPMVANRYISSAPLSTADHLKFLEQIERALTAK
jgi:hypothetical protein